MISGIYFITNKLNNHTYVGSSKNVNERLVCHRRKLKINKHVNPHLQYAWNKYGEDNFRFEVAEEVPVEELLIVEQYYLDLARITPWFYYNVNYKSECPPNTKGQRYNVGNKHSNETKLKISQALLGRRYTAETITNMSKAKLGNKNPFFEKHHTKETRKKISKAMKGNKSHFLANIIQKKLN